ncbi:MAG TPA: endolytic transglycosylase MltG [Solirubrobacterales bacterium]
MTDDWLPEDPFVNPEDPAAAERERRRLEREERRRRREEGGGGGESDQEKPRRRWGRRKSSEAPAVTPPEEPAAQPAAEPKPSAPQPPPQPEAPPPARPDSPTPQSPVEPAPADPPSAPVEEPAPPRRVPVMPPAPEQPPAGRPPTSPVPPRSPDEQFWDEPAAAGDDGSDEYAFTAPRPSADGPSRRAGGGFFAALRRHPFRLLGAIAALVVLWFVFALFQPFHGDGSGKVVVTIPKGAGVSEVGDLLDGKGVISSSTLFQLRATLAGKRSDLYAGRFVLAHDMSYSAVLDKLSVPPVKKTTTVTIPEGYSRELAAPLVSEDGLSGSYMKETVRSKYLKPAAYGGKSAKNLEGFLFPDTFELKPGAPAADLVQLQLQDFKRRIKGVDMSYARSKNLTTYDVLTIASMVDREAQLESERPLVAAVIYNRLHQGIPLGIDATTRFAVHNYTRPLTESELATPSPYNTRTHQGLPPGPIDSPGLASIEAAAHPAKVGYLYYVVKPGACGELSFSKTNAEFEADVERYNAARAANGGNSPTTCGQ